MKPTYRKSWVGNLLMWSHLTLDPSFKVKRQPNLKMCITSGILILYVFYFCFYMFAMFGETLLARNKAIKINIAIKNVIAKILHYHPFKPDSSTSVGYRYKLHGNWLLDA